MELTAAERDSSKLDSGPPRPPRQGRSIMDMAGSAGPTSDPVSMTNPAVQVMAIMGELRQKILELSAALPTLAPGLQQVLMGLEQVVPQQIADIVAGNPPGSGGSAMGAAQANAAPTAPPVQTGMP